MYAPCLCQPVVPALCLSFRPAGARFNVDTLSGAAHQLQLHLAPENPLARAVLGTLGYLLGVASCPMQASF